MSMIRSALTASKAKKILFGAASPRLRAPAYLARFFNFTFRQLVCANGLEVW